MGSNLNSICYDINFFLKHAREQTIATNKGALERKNLLPKYLCVFNYLKISFEIWNAFSFLDDCLENKQF